MVVGELVDLIGKKRKIRDIEDKGNNMLALEALEIIANGESSAVEF